MVKLEEIFDDDLTEEQPGPIEEDDEDFVDTGRTPSLQSEISHKIDSSLSQSDDEDERYGTSETLGERVIALKDMIPPQTRRSLGSVLARTASVAKSTALVGGNSMWILSTSALLILVPWTIALVEEQQITEQEREMKAQEGLREGLTPGVPAAEAGRAAGVGPTL